MTPGFCWICNADSADSGLCIGTTFTASFLFCLDHPLKEPHGWLCPCSGHFDFVFPVAEEITVTRQWFGEWFTAIEVSDEVKYKTWFLNKKKLRYWQVQGLISMLK